ncbi:MAG: DUF2325 domain-containing protein [Firmicutes bacterium]|nr:DUF2325 domain-containing protein [Bacillota bacterium]
MSIVLVGGHDRMHDIYKAVCKKFGHKVKVFTQMPAKFNRQIGNPDGILLFTKTVSHKMVGVAIKEAKRKNIPVVRCHNSSTVSLEQSIKLLENNAKAC